MENEVEFTFCVDGREVVRLTPDGEIVFATEVTLSELRSAVVYLVSKVRASTPSSLTAEQARRAMKRIRTEVDGLSDKDMKGFEDEIERGAAIITSELMTPSPSDETLRLLLRQLREIAPIFANQKCPLCSWGGSDTHRSDCPFVLAKEVAAAPSSSLQSTARKIAERIYDDIADLFAMPVDRVACVASIEAKISAELSARKE